MFATYARVSSWACDPSAANASFKPGELASSFGSGGGAGKGQPEGEGQASSKAKGKGGSPYDPASERGGSRQEGHEAQG